MLAEFPICSVLFVREDKGRIQQTLEGEQDVSLENGVDGQGRQRHLGERKRRGERSIGGLNR